MRNLTTIILQASDATSQTSAIIHTGQLYALSLQIFTSDSTAVGTAQVQISNDPPPGQEMTPFTPTNWVNLPSATASITGGTPALISVPQFVYEHMRVVYTSSTPGTGTITIQLNGQGY